SWSSPHAALFPYTTLYQSLPKHLPGSDVGGKLQAVSNPPVAISNRPVQGAVFFVPDHPKKPSCLFASSDILSGDQGGFQTMKKTDRKSTRLNSSHVKISYA